PLRRVSEMSVKPEAPNFFDEYTKGMGRKYRGFLAPFQCVKAVQAATELPFDQGMKRERELFSELVTSPQSKAQRHVFFAEREVMKIPGLPETVKPREVKRAAVIGAGTMGGGIAMCFANAGIPVTVLETKQEFLDKGLATIRKNYEASAKKGKLTSAQAGERMSLLQPTLSYADVAQADIVIEAVFEDLAVKEGVFRQLDE